MILHSPMLVLLYRYYCSPMQIWCFSLNWLPWKSVHLSPNMGAIHQSYMFSPVCAEMTSLGQRGFGWFDSICGYLAWCPFSCSSYILCAEFPFLSSFGKRVWCMAPLASALPFTSFQGNDTFTFVSPALAILIVGGPCLQWYRNN